MSLGPGLPTARGRDPGEGRWPARGAGAGLRGDTYRTRRGPAGDFQQEARQQDGPLQRHGLHVRRACNREGRCAARSAPRAPGRPRRRLPGPPGCPDGQQSGRVSWSRGLRPRPAAPRPANQGVGEARCLSLHSPPRPGPGPLLLQPAARPTWSPQQGAGGAVASRPGLGPGRPGSFIWQL